MKTEHKLVSDVTVFSKYARYWPDLGRRENYEEIVARNYKMHADRVESMHLAGLPVDKDKALELLDEAYPLVAGRKVFPSMRSFQFGGAPIELSHNRVFNCAFRFANEPSFFSDLMFLLLGGTGVGYSVQRQHVEQLPSIKQPGAPEEHVVQDSIEGWHDAVKALVDAYLVGMPLPVFDYSKVRPKGSVLVTSGGRAPGPDPLKKTLDQLQELLAGKQPGDKLRPIEVHDMATFVARAVLSGGIRRSAMISLFSPDDEEMLTAKSGAWWEKNPERAFANNSAVLLRGVDDELFEQVFERARASGSGEPGVYWVDDRRYGTNPCAEITLNHKQFCNLTTMNVGTIESQEDFNKRARAAAIIGTFQASYTNFHTLSEGWRAQTEDEALLGVSMTGIASGAIDELDAEEAAAHAVAANIETAAVLCIKPAARVTTIKPEGTASLVAGTSSGIHAWHDAHYIRRMRFNKSEPIAQYLMQALPYRVESDDSNPEIVEDDVFNPEQIVLAIPQSAPEGALTRDEGALATLERVKRYHKQWVKPGNSYGGMPNNVSATINVRDNEWDAVKDWMWNNRYEYNGLSLLPYSDHTYKQAPYQSISEEQYKALSERLSSHEFNLERIDESEDYTDLTGELACVGGACELPW